MKLWDKIKNFLSAGAVGFKSFFTRSRPPGEKPDVPPVDEPHEEASQKAHRGHVQPDRRDIFVDKLPQKNPTVQPGRRKPHKEKPRMQSRYPKLSPALICKGVKNEWWVAVDVRKVPQVESVQQGETFLQEDPDGDYLLDDVSQNVVVRFSDGTKDRILELSDDTHPLVFQTRKKWEGTGRKVKAVSDGFYIVFAPESCGARKNASPPIAPRPSYYEGLTVHYFSPVEGADIDGFEHCNCVSPKKRFALQGKRIPDDSNAGDLFSGELPILTDTEDWRDISWVAVGEEGGGEWREVFNPKEKQLANVLQGRDGGWYFVRIYDEDDELIHSMDFRYLKGLNAILVNDNSEWQNVVILPQRNGHKEETVKFSSELDVQLKGTSSGIRQVSENIFSIAPKPDNDHSQWTLSCGNASVEIEIMLRRLWWSLTGEDEKPAWRAKPVKMSRQQMRDYPEEQLTVRAPSEISEISVGFAECNLPFPLVYDDSGKFKSATIPLSGFSDDKAVENPLQEAAFLRLQIDAKKVPVIRIPADAQSQPVPSIELLPPSAMKTLEAWVKKPGGWREGKGFSYGELESADMSVKELNRYGARFNKRRRSIHSQNTELLKSLQEE